MMLSDPIALTCARDLLGYTKKDLRKSYFFFDIDDTLLRACAYDDGQRIENIKKTYPFYARHKYYDAIRKDRRVELCDPFWPEVMSILHERGAHIFALSAITEGFFVGPLTRSQWRYHDLERHGIILSQDITDKNWIFPYYRGVLLCSLYSKSLIFESLFIKNLPKDVNLVLVDDLKKHGKSWLHGAYPLCNRQAFWYQ